MLASSACKSSKMLGMLSMLAMLGLAGMIQGHCLAELLHLHHVLLSSAPPHDVV